MKYMLGDAVPLLESLDSSYRGRLSQSAGKPCRFHTRTCTDNSDPEKVGFDPGFGIESHSEVCGPVSTKGETERKLQVETYTYKVRKLKSHSEPFLGAKQSTH